MIRVRYLATLFGGAAAGLGGSFLSLSYTPMWMENMTSGRGWIALALVVFGSWRPWRVLAGAYLFGGVTILQLHAQGTFHLPAQVFSMLPYLATIAVLTIISAGPWRGRFTAPADLGKTFPTVGLNSRARFSTNPTKGDIMATTVTRRTFLAGTAAAAGTAALASPGRLLAADALPVAFVYTGPIGDHGYTFAHDVGRKAVEAHYGDKVKVTFVENVPEGPDCERVIRQLATSGNQLIFATSFGFMESTLKVAKQFPKLKFEHATGFKRAPNMAIYNARFYEGRAVLGDIAGRMSKTGVAGYVASFPIPEVVMGINAFTLAAQKQNPNFKTKVIWCNTWYDPGKESDAAKALIDKGADIIAQHTDSAAPLQVAEARGVYAFGQATDMRSFAPKAQLTAVVDLWANYYIDRVKKVMDGTWTSTDIWWGFKEGLVGLAPYNDAMPADVKAAADKLKADITSGAVHPFTGPIKNQKGEVALAAGKKATDEEMLKMNWYVAGVES